MTQVADTTCLYTMVKNLTGSARTFGFLGEHGMRLAADEAVLIRGDLIAKLGAQTSARQFKALEKSLRSGTLQIVSTPGVHLYDAVADETRILALENGVLGLVDPCWNASGSSDFEAG